MAKRQILEGHGDKFRNTIHWSFLFSKKLRLKKKKKCEKEHTSLTFYNTPKFWKQFSHKKHIFKMLHS